MLLTGTMECMEGEMPKPTIGARLTTRYGNNTLTGKRMVNEANIHEVQRYDFSLKTTG